VDTNVISIQVFDDRYMGDKGVKAIVVRGTKDIKLSMLNPVYFLMYCTGEKLNITQIEGQFPQAPYAKYEDQEAAGGSLEEAVSRA
jgi:hypothetical protein